MYFYMWVNFPDSLTFSFENIYKSFITLTVATLDIINACMNIE